MIQSITGRRTQHEVENPTRVARQAVLADWAMKLLENEATPTEDAGGSKMPKSA
jgi:hypothetical protein